MASAAIIAISWSPNQWRKNWSPSKNDMERAIRLADRNMCPGHWKNRSSKKKLERRRPDQQTKAQGGTSTDQRQGQSVVFPALSLAEAARGLFGFLDHGEAPFWIL
jgi:hypothetical protein